MDNSDVVRAIGPEDPPPSPAGVRAQLRRILASTDFGVPDRDRRFLGYVIEETIAGRAERLKAYSIAIEVFGRDNSFDAQTDPVVRIEASRIRRALERYYLTAGVDDPILITMPKGGYVPVFAWRDGKVDKRETGTPAAPREAARSAAPLWAWPLAAVLLVLALVAADRILGQADMQPSSAVAGADSARAAPDVPRLLVVPFEDLSGTPNSAIIARGLTDEVIWQIARFKEIVVLVGRAGEPAGTDSRAIRYVLEGSLRTDGNKLRLTARLIDRTDGSVAWVGSYDASFTARELIQTESEIARDVATAIAQPYGIIFRADAAKASDGRPNDWEAYSCTLAYYAYRAKLQPGEHVRVRECLERAVDRFPGYATGWSLLSLTYLDELRFRYRINADGTPPLDRALAAARRAVALDPVNVRGLQAEMTALFFKKDVETALAVGARAITINPNDTELVGEYGMRLAMSGEWKRGGEIILGVLERNPGPLGYYETGLALSFYMQRDYAAAAAWIRRANVGANPMYHIVAAAIFGQQADSSAAAAEREWLVRNAPQLLNEVGRELAMRNIPPEDQAHFLEGLRKAGLVVAAQ